MPRAALRLAALVALLALAACAETAGGGGSSAGATSDTQVTVERSEGPVERGQLFWDGLGRDGQMVGGTIEQEIRPIELRVRAVSGQPLSETDRAEVVRDLATCPEGESLGTVETTTEAEVFVVTYTCSRLIE